MASSKGIKAGRAFVEIGVSNKLAAGLKKAQRRLRLFGNGVKAIGQTMLRTGSIISAPFAASLVVFAKFDDKMRAVKAITGATEEQFRSLREEARRLGRTTSFTASQVASAMTELARAGFDTSQIKAATGDVLNLARATRTELARATEIAGGALRSFSLDVGQTGRVVDVLTATANGSAQTVDELADSLKFVAPLATEAGSTIEDTAAALGVLANNGIKGSLAGTALARAFKNLSQSAKQDELAQIGVSAVDAAGNLRPITDIINDLAKAMQGFGSGRRLSIFESLFGRGEAAALKLASSATAFDDLKKKIINSAGVAKQTADEMDAGIGGAFRLLLSSVQDVAISIGEAIDKPVRIAANVVKKVANMISKFVTENKRAVQIVLAVGAGLIVLGATLLFVGVSIVFVSALIGGIATVIATLGSIITGIPVVLGAIGVAIGALASPIGIAIAGVIALGGAILKYSGAGGAIIDWLKGKFGELKDFVGKVTGGISDALTTGDIQLAGKVLWLGLKVVWETGVAALNTIWLRGKKFFIGVFNEMWFGAKAAFEIGVTAVENAWIEMNAFLSNTWTNFTNTFKSIWETAVSFVAKRIIDIQGFFDSTLNTTAVKTQIDEELNAKLDALEKEKKKKFADREEFRRLQREESQKQSDANLTKIGQEFEAAQKALDEATSQRVNDAQNALDEARKNLEGAIATANNNSGSGVLGEKSDIIDKIKNLLAGGIGSGLITGQSIVRGTFNIAAIQGLTASTGANEQTAKNTANIAAHTKKIADSTRNGGLAFG